MAGKQRFVFELMRFYFLCASYLFLAMPFAHGQTNSMPKAKKTAKAKDPESVTFGLVAAPLLGAYVPGTARLSYVRDQVRFQTDLRGGQVLGAQLRFKINNVFAFQTGLQQAVRRYELTMTDSLLRENGNYRTVVARYGITSYQIPTVLLLSLRTGKRTWLRGDIGLETDFFVSGVSSKKVDTFFQRGYRNHVVSPAGTFSLGFEYDAHAYGHVYLGVHYHRQLSNIYLDSARYFRPDLTNTTGSGWLQGHYASVELKWFFPTKTYRRKAAPDPMDMIEEVPESNSPLREH